MTEATAAPLYNDTAAAPCRNADSQAELARCLRPELLEKYEVHSYHHAAVILCNAFPAQLAEIQQALMDFTITTVDIGSPGGNESIVPKKFSSLLRPQGWAEARILGDLHVRLEEYLEAPAQDGSLHTYRCAPQAPHLLTNFIDGHKIDYLKGRVALDLEWNSKDQTFDRDLYAMRAFHECGLISAGIVLTRSADLDPLFAHIPQLDKHGQPEHTPTGALKTVRKKYGASTTWMGKLLYRLNAGRQGTCPILAFGIKPAAVADWNPDA